MIYKSVRHLVYFSCEKNVIELVSISKKLSEMGYSFSMVTLESERGKNIGTFLHRKYTSRCLVAVDCGCERYDNLLLEASQIRYFNQSHSWLILDKKGYGIDNILGPLSNISVNSDMTFANQMDQCKLYFFFNN